MNPRENGTPTKQQTASQRENCWCSKIHAVPVLLSAPFCMASSPSPQKGWTLCMWSRLVGRMDKYWVYHHESCWFSLWYPLSAGALDGTVDALAQWSTVHLTSKMIRGAFSIDISRNICAGRIELPLSAGLVPCALGRSCPSEHFLLQMTLLRRTLGEPQYCCIYRYQNTARSPLLKWC